MRLDVADVEHRVRRRFDPHQPRLVGERLAHDVGVRHVDERMADAHRADDVAQLLGGAVIALDRRQHVIARPEQAENRERCAGAGRIRSRLRAAFERRDALLERAAARDCSGRM